MIEYHIAIQPSIEKLAMSFMRGTVATFLKNELNRLAASVERYAKQLTPVDVGLLRSSIDFTPVTIIPKTIVETNTDYACIYGSDTQVVTNKGGKRISDIKIGDLVLTQD